jgi:hypothetical protein
MLRRKAGFARVSLPKQFVAALAFAVVTATPLSAQINFNGLTAFPNDGGVRNVPNSYVEGGIRFTAVGPLMGFPGLVSFAPGNEAYIPASGPALTFNFGQYLELTAANGVSPFSLTSVALAPVFIYPFPQTMPVTFTGFRTVGGTATQVINLPLSASMFTQYSLPNLSGSLYSRVEIRAGDPDGTFQIDNVNASAVPEPSTYLMMVVGLAGMGLVARRRART